jgi:hypothetical protein
MGPAHHVLAVATLLAPALLACSPGPRPPSGLVILGGTAEETTAAELWAPRRQCLLPTMPGLMFSPTVDVVDGVIVACSGAGCSRLERKGRHEAKEAMKALKKKKLPKRQLRKELARIEEEDRVKGRWVALQPTLQWRVAHTSAVLDSGVLLVGGSGSPNTTEVVEADGGPGREGFQLEVGRQFHCSIQLGDRLILTGGLGSERLVTEHIGLEEDEPAARELPGLLTGRYYHACGCYSVPDGQGGEAGQRLIVSGGWNGYLLASTQVLDTQDLYTSYNTEGAGGWREVDALPSPLWGLRGATIAGAFHVTGGWVAQTGDEGGSWVDTDEILAWDPVTETWSVAGVMSTTRVEAHAVAEVPLATANHLCTVE